MTTETERRLREALRAGADAITLDTDSATGVAGPWRGPTGKTSKPHRTWLAMAAAAAVVVVAAGITIALNVGHPDKDVAPANSPHPSVNVTSPAPSGALSSAPSSTATRRGPFVPVTCKVDLPQSWNKAMGPRIQPPNAPSYENSLGLAILAIAPTGDVVTYSETAPNGELVLVTPSGATRTLYQLPTSESGHSRLRIGTAQIEGNWVVFSIVLGGGQGAIGGIDAIDLDTGNRTVVRPTSAGTDLIVSRPQLLHGQVFWSEVDTSGHGSVYADDLATGTRSTLDSGTIVEPQTVGGAVEWLHNGSIRWHGTPQLPTGFQLTPGNSANLLRDGNTYAWTAWQGTGTHQRLVIKMSRTGLNHPETVYTPPNPDVLVQLLGLSGYFLFFDDGTNITALDTHTGATTALEPSRPSFNTLAAAGGVIALNGVGSKGGAQLSFIKTSALSGMHC